MSRHISSEQFSFLKNREIHEAVGTAQEALHSIKHKKIKGAILKIDLAKAFDKVNWIYIKMILIHLGFPPPFINWIMCCFNLASFSVLINGFASHFFHAERGLRQGCPLSPLLFLIVMEGLRILITTTKRDGQLHRLKMNDLCYLTHLLFVDDVLIFLDCNQQDSSTFHDILNLFAMAINMEENHSKSTITLSYTFPHEARIAHQFFPFQQHHLEDGLKYLGF